MLTDEVATLFRRYCDEPDSSFLSEADVALYCKLGYAEFRNMVNEYSPSTIQRVTPIVVVNQIQYDLAQADDPFPNGNPATALGTPSIMGANPNMTTNSLHWTSIGRMTRLLSVYLADPTTLQPRAKFQVMSKDTTFYPGAPMVMLQGTKLTFSGNMTGTFLIKYNFEQEIGLSTGLGAVAVNQTDQSWLDLVTGAIVSLPINDDLQQWHDLIALMAYDQYAIIDAASNQQLMSRINTRKTEFRDYLQQRLTEGAQFVTSTWDPLDDSSTVLI